MASFSSGLTITRSQVFESTTPFNTGLPEALVYTVPAGRYAEVTALSNHYVARVPSNGLQITIGQNTRLAGGMQVIRQAIANGNLGTLTVAVQVIEFAAGA
jgi:hypothetical protein